MNLEEAKVVLSKAYTSPAPRIINITGYISSTGSIKNYTVELMGKDGYKDLVRASLAELHNNPSKYTSLSPDSPVAVAELIASFTKTLNPDMGKQSTARNDNLQLVYTNGFYTGVKDGQDIVVIKNLKLLSSSSEFEDIVLPKSSAAIAKHNIRIRLPIIKYIAQLQLSHGKFQDLTSPAK